MRKRDRKPDDHVNAQKAVQLLYKLVELNPRIDGNLWVSAYFYMLAETFKLNDFTLDEFKRSLDDFFANYKGQFE